MKRPPITPGQWATSPQFPASVIAGEVEETPKGRSARIVCRVQGSVLPTFRNDLKAIAALPDLLDALEGAYRHAAAMQMKGYTIAERRELAASQWTGIREALTKAGYTFT